jgi:hypothetical protein
MLADCLTKPLKAAQYQESVYIEDGLSPTWETYPPAIQIFNVRSNISPGPGQDGTLSTEPIAELGGDLR